MLIKAILFLVIVNNNLVHSLILVENVSKIYLKTSLFSPPEQAGLFNVDLTLPSKCSICTFVGPSGSGKSTLTELICGIKEPSSGAIELVNDADAADTCDSMQIRGERIDPLYYTTYNHKKTVRVLLAETTKNHGDIPAHCGYESMLSAATEVLNVPMDMKVNSLLETERFNFDILLAIHRIADRSVSLVAQRLKPILILDEYVDKAVSSVRRRFFDYLHILGKHPDVKLQVLVPTHCRRVMEDSDFVVALNQGRVFSKGKPSAVRLPNQLHFIDD